MSIHTILSQQRQEFEKLKVCCPLCGWRTGLVYHECPICRGFIGNVFNWYLAFTTRIVEEMGEELIGSDEHLIPYGKDYPEYQRVIDNEDITTRNRFRALQRTKLQKMKI